MIDEINKLLIEASEQQRGLFAHLGTIQLQINAMENNLKLLKSLRKDLDTLKDTPRDKAKELALQYVLDGHDSAQLPRALKLRYRKSYNYDETEMVFWLISGDYVDALKIDKKELGKILKVVGSGGTPATEVETAEIACDTDLMWMTES